MEREITFEDIVQIEKDLGISREGMITFLGKKPAGFYNFRSNGVSLPAQNLIKILRAYPEVFFVINAAPDALRCTRACPAASVHDGSF